MDILLYGGAESPPTSLLIFVAVSNVNVMSAAGVQYVTPLLISWASRVDVVVYVALNMGEYKKFSTYWAIRHELVRNAVGENV
jgi:hypothetical protein